MKKILLLLIISVAASGIITAQSRNITRGAEEGELYLSTAWYCDYGVWGDTRYDAILHITENGKKVEMNHSVKYRSPDTGIADSLPMQLISIIADATPGLFYNFYWCYKKDNGQYY
jgi:hypothetical protein